jgi:hypothetical protein
MDMIQWIAFQANLYISHNFYRLRIEYFGKIDKNWLLEKYRNLSDLIAKRLRHI